MTPEDQRAYIDSLLSEMRDSLARRTAILDQLTAHIRSNRDLWSEARFEELLEDLSIKQAQIEVDKMILRQKEKKRDRY